MHSEFDHKRFQLFETPSTRRSNTADGNSQAFRYLFIIRRGYFEKKGLQKFFAGRAELLQGKPNEMSLLPCLNLILGKLIGIG